MNRAALLLVLVVLTLACGAEAQVDDGIGVTGSANGPILTALPSPLVLPGSQPSMASDGTLIFDYAPGLAANVAAAHPLPPCTTATSCAMQCQAYATGNAWRCVDGNGNPFTVTQGTAGTIEDAQGRIALQIFSDANAPKIAAADSGALTTVWLNPHTIIFTGNAYITTNTIPYVYVEGTSSNGFHFRSEAGTRCIWRNSTGTPTEANALVSIPAVTAGMGFYACRKSGTGAASSYTTWANGTTATVAWAYDPGNPGASDNNFGRNIGTTLWLGGQYESITLYSVAKTDAELAALQADWAGINPATSLSADDLVYSRGGQLWTLNSAGQYLPVAAVLPVIDSQGLMMGEHSAVSGLGATWATDNLDASSWTAVGTPTTTTNVASGPFSAWRNTAEADRIVDDDAGAFEGYKSVTNAATTVDRFTCSAFLKQGDTGAVTTKARIVVEQNGSTDVATCDKTLTSSFARYSCTGDTSGSVTAVRCRIVVGNAASDTGSILIAQAQMNADGWAAAPLVGNGSVGVDDLTSTSNEVDQWSTAVGHTHEIIFTPDFSRADTFDAEDTYEPLDLTDNAQTDHRVLLWHYQNNDPAMATRGSGGALSTTDTYGSAVSEVAGTTYAFRIKWEPVGGGFVNHFLYFNACPGSVATCSATTLIGSDTTGTKVAPTTDWGVLQIGCRYNNILCLSGHIQRVRIWQRGRGPLRRRRAAASRSRIMGRTRRSEAPCSCA